MLKIQPNLRTFEFVCPHCETTLHYQAMDHGIPVSCGTCGETVWLHSKLKFSEKEFRKQAGITEKKLTTGVQLFSALTIFNILLFTLLFLFIILKLENNLLYLLRLISLTVFVDIIAAIFLPRSIKKAFDQEGKICWKLIPSCLSEKYAPRYHVESTLTITFLRIPIFYSEKEIRVFPYENLKTPFLIMLGEKDPESELETNLASSTVNKWIFALTFTFAIPFVNLFIFNELIKSYKKLKADHRELVSLVISVARMMPVSVKDVALAKGVKKQVQNNSPAQQRKPLKLTMK